MKRAPKDHPRLGKLSMAGLDPSVALGAAMQIPAPKGSKAPKAKRPAPVADPDYVPEPEAKAKGKKRPAKKP